MRLINLTVPLVLVKNWFYLLSNTFSILLILLPLSVLTYNRFYETLIPNTLPHIPIKLFDYRGYPHPFFKSKDTDLFIQSTENLGHYFPGSVSNVVDVTGLTKKYGQFDPLLDYEIDVNVGFFCQEKPGQGYKVLYEVVLFDTYPLVNSSFQHSVYLNCDERHVYRSKNWLVPFNWKDNVSPFLVNWSRFVKLELDHLVVPGWKLNKEVDKLQIALVVDQNGNTVDDDSISISFRTHFTGFRWYLIKYYWTSLTLGTLLFWGISAFVCVLTSYGLLWI